MSKTPRLREMVESLTAILIAAGVLAAKDVGDYIRGEKKAKKATKPTFPTNAVVDKWWKLDGKGRFEPIIAKYLADQKRPPLTSQDSKDWNAVDWAKVANFLYGMALAEWERGQWSGWAPYDS